MKKLLWVLFLLSFCVVVLAADFNVKSLDGGDVLMIQPHQEKKGWTLVTVETPDGIYIVHVDDKQTIRYVYYWDGRGLKLVFETRKA